MAVGQRPRWLRAFVVSVGVIFLFTCILSTYAHAQAHNAAGTCQGMSEDKDSCLWSDKFQGPPRMCGNLSCPALLPKRSPQLSSR